MKKICRTIKLRKFKSLINDFKSIEGNTFAVLFEDGKYERVYLKEDLTRLLEKDHIRPILYIFDMADKIIVNRDILIDTDEVAK